MRFLKNSAHCLIVLSAISLAGPALAQAPNGFPITDVNLRAGPGTEYPVILTVPADAPITILGCVPDYTWCDSVFEDRRGWMRSIYLSGYSEGDYYLLRDYAPDLGYRRVTFNIDAYWDSNYRDEPFYGDRGRWTGPREAGWVDDGVFYDRLSPHGSWTWIQGRYVWVPANVDRGWRPYTRGRWVYTDRGWTWVSNEPFGWATYHYGRWGFSDRVGWFWTPGNQWAPAWVSWRQSDDYLAWAPLPPAYDGGYDRGYGRDGGGININISFGDVPDYYWSMVPSRDFLSDDLSRHYVHDRARRRRDFERTRPVGHTTIVNKTVVNNVVNVNYVEQKTSTKVVERQIAATDNPEQAGKVEGDTLEVYEPQADDAPEAKAPPEPRDVEDVAAASETKAQAEGEATTEDMLAPPEVQEAAKERKGRKGRKTDAEANAETEAKGEAALPEGDIADAPPPAKKAAEDAPVPAHEIAAPKAEEPSPAKGTESEAAPKPSGVTPEAEAQRRGEDKGAPKDTAPQDAAPKTPEPKTPEPKTPEPEESKAESGTKETPAESEKPEDTTERRSKKDAGPADKAPEPAESQDETPPAQDKPAQAEKPNAPQDTTRDAKPAPEAPPEAKTPEPNEPEAKKATPEEPEAKTPEAQKPEVKAPEAPAPEAPAPKTPEAKTPEAKTPGAKTPKAKTPEVKPQAKTPQAKTPAPKTPQAKTPAPKKPEAKKPEAKSPPPKPEAKKPAPKPQAKTPASKKPAPQKREAKTPQRNAPQRKAPQAAKREAKHAPAEAKERRAQKPESQGKPNKPAKGKKAAEKN